MTTSTDTAPGATSTARTSEAPGPSATFTVRQEDGRLVFALRSSPEPVRVGMVDQEIDIEWEGADLRAELTFDLEGGLELTDVRLGWVEEDLRSGSAVTLPFRASYDADRRVLTLAEDHDRLSPVYTMTFVAQVAGKTLAHDPKIHNQGPPSITDSPA